MRRGQIHVGGVSQRRGWTRKCGGSKFMWTVFAEAAVGAQRRRAQTRVDGVCGAAVGAQMRPGQIHVDGVCRGGGGRENAAVPKFM